MKITSSQNRLLIQGNIAHCVALDCFGVFFSKLIPQVFIHNWGSGEAIEYA